MMMMMNYLRVEVLTLMNLNLVACGMRYGAER